jgi:hypothetical protein
MKGMRDLGRAVASVVVIFGLIGVIAATVTP